MQSGTRCHHIQCQRAGPGYCLHTNCPQPNCPFPVWVSVQVPGVQHPLRVCSPCSSESKGHQWRVLGTELLLILIPPKHHQEVNVSNSPTPDKQEVEEVKQEAKEVEPEVEAVEPLVAPEDKKQVEEVKQEAKEVKLLLALDKQEVGEVKQEAKAK